MANPLGSFSLVLHAHLPWVLNHGTWPHGTSWLNEAACETYLPILIELNDLVAAGYTPHISIGLTPVLSEMLVDEKFKVEFSDYLKFKVESARHDRAQFLAEHFPQRVKTADFWIEYFNKITDAYEQRFHSDIAGAFSELQQKGVIEIITCAATHGYFPLLSRDSSISAQVKTGVESYKRIFGQAPRGIWMPECAYRPSYNWLNPITKEEYPRKGVEWFLAYHGLEYTFVDTHLTMGGVAHGVYAARFELLKELWDRFAEQYTGDTELENRTPYHPYLFATSEPQSPVAFFTRDERTGILVWSGEHGYPGDGTYLDFHKKHFPGGNRYWKVTAAKTDLGAKQEYRLEDTPARLDENASHYKDTVKGLLYDYNKASKKQGLVTAMYDCELYGHWWFEGPWWLNRILRWIEDDPELRLTTAGQYISENPPVQTLGLPEGSWGQGGGHWIWLNEWTTWTWEKIYECEQKMEELAEKYSNREDETLQNICKQVARENLLLQASDWQFLISTWSARDYAEARVALHYENFIKLFNMATTYGEGRTVPQGNWEFLGRVKQDDNLFPDIELEWFKKIE
ncbi:MAG TPA: 1,4-alpha-glucan branching protein domain-containing protein [Candidatus Lokiarchaeia archaeon]|nr:1,4-alpha-glucan branching protein domain-containing protein [Candidatus Lokiarchaeia archaeon]